MTDISNGHDLLNSSDVIERIEELTCERADFESAIEEAQEAYDDYVADEEEYNAQQADALAGEISTARNALATWDADEKEELDSLVKFADDLEGYGDWAHGETLIRESYWVEYCKEMLEDCGDLPSDLPHYIVIDWEATASNLRIDYTESELDGVTYLMRA